MIQLADSRHILDSGVHRVEGQLIISGANTEAMLVPTTTSVAFLFLLIGQASCGKEFTQLTVTASAPWTNDLAVEATSLLYASHGSVQCSISWGRGPTQKQAARISKS